MMWECAMFHSPHLTHSMALPEAHMANHSSGGNVLKGIRQQLDAVQFPQGSVSGWDSHFATGRPFKDMLMDSILTPTKHEITSAHQKDRAHDLETNKPKESTTI